MPSPSPDRRSSASIPATASTVIVGGGIVGIATALFLAQRGVPAIVLEAAPDIGSRTTSMSAHCIRAQFSEPDNIRMMAESLDFYEQFAMRCQLDPASADIDLCQQGYLFASTDPNDATAFASRVDQQRMADLDDVELLSGEDVRRRFPWLSDQIAIATYRARDGWIDSYHAVVAMAAASRVPVFLNVEVTEILTAGGKVTGVRTATGAIATDTVILAAGPFSRKLSPEPLPITLLRRHRVIIGPHPDIPQSGPVTIDANTGAHWRPHRGGALLAWAQPEIDCEASWPVTPDPGFVDAILVGDGGVARLAPFWSDIAGTVALENILLTAGQYTMTPDHRPLIGPAPVTSGLYLHTGYSGHGIMGAPAGARMLADLLVGDTPHGNPFSPSRFDGSLAPPDVERVVI